MMNWDQQQAHFNNILNNMSRSGGGREHKRDPNEARRHFASDEVLQREQQVRQAEASRDVQLVQKELQDLQGLHSRMKSILPDGGQKLQVRIAALQQELQALSSSHLNSKSAVSPSSSSLGLESKNSVEGLSSRLQNLSLHSNNNNNNNNNNLPLSQRFDNEDQVAAFNARSTDKTKLRHRQHTRHQPPVRISMDTANQRMNNSRAFMTESAMFVDIDQQATSEKVEVDSTGDHEDRLCVVNWSGNNQVEE
jgi:hypothetical protein